MRNSPGKFGDSISRFYLCFVLLHSRATVVMRASDPLPIVVRKPVLSVSKSFFVCLFVFQVFKFSYFYDFVSFSLTWDQITKKKLQTLPLKSCSNNCQIISFCFYFLTFIIRFR